MLTSKKLLNRLKAFQVWEISFCRRSQNRIADHLSMMDCPEFTTFEAYLLPAAYEWYLQEKVAADPIDGDQG